MESVESLLEFTKTCMVELHYRYVRKRELQKKLNLRGKMNILEEYCKVNKMRVNKERTEILIFQGGRPKKDLSISCENVPLEIVNSFNYFGVTFSSSKNVTSSFP